MPPVSPSAYPSAFRVASLIASDGAGVGSSCAVAAGVISVRSSSRLYASTDPDVAVGPTMPKTVPSDDTTGEPLAVS